MTSAWRRIGVLGGMGPAATADFFARLVRAVGAGRDQDHPPVILHSASTIPDRTAHLLGDGPDPAPAMIVAARVVQEAGAELLAIPCNSAHAYVGELQRALDIPVLDMIRLAAAACAGRVGDGGRVGVLAATGTARLGLYAASLQEAGLQTLMPPDDHQDVVMAVVRGVKGGGTSGHDDRIDPVIAGLRDAGADAILLACTELPLAVDGTRVPVPVVDATEALVRGTLQAAAKETGKA